MQGWLLAFSSAGKMTNKCQHLCQMGAGWNFCVPQHRRSIPRYPVLPITARTSVSSRWPPSPRARSLLAPPVPDKTSPLLYRLVQLPFAILPCFCIYKRDVLVARVIIHAYNDHVRLLSPKPLVVNNHSLLGSKEPTLL